MYTNKFNEFNFGSTKTNDQDITVIKKRMHTVHYTYGNLRSITHRKDYQVASLLLTLRYTHTHR